MKIGRIYIRLLAIAIAIIDHEVIVADYVLVNR